MSFDPGNLEVREGDTVPVRIRYRVSSLDSPLQLAISALPITASSADFELLNTRVEIPAGQEFSGEATAELRVLRDAFFDEGDESIDIRFVPDPEVRADFGADLRVVLREAGVSPCPGVDIIASRPTPGEGGDLVKRLLSVWVNRGLDSLAMEFLGPYDVEPPCNYESVTGNCRELPPTSSIAVAVDGWTAETDGDVLKHEMDIQWGPELLTESDLRLVFLGGQCAGEGVTCSRESCELNP
ncbi:MAG: hypothetical protein OXC11_15445 [Rhodospirillales bacterium]|nr:hypothetical protein [Rhodospirillales bacterium]